MTTTPLDSGVIQMAAASHFSRPNYERVRHPEYPAVRWFREV